MNQKERIEQSVKEVTEREGFELVELSIGDRGHKTLVRVFADRPAGGISIDECARLSGRLSDRFNLENVFERAYILQVSSPGLERPLVSRRDFERKVGREVRIWLNENGTTWEASGELLAVNDDGLLIRTERGEKHFSFNAVAKGKEIL
ncbi:MAG: ribosome maturation factor RimP [candidate division Zixibacteria bacterium]|nr:ribosome maturation factor RimP [candidate division Zixibacteria bacterium]MCI0596853.1 ribosome maturation factor RimP [candidate division Zixibacteria bacterium]